MVKEFSMLMDGQTDFLELLFGSSDGLNLDGEVNFVIPQERELDQQLDQTLDMSQLQEFELLTNEPTTFDVDCQETVVSAQEGSPVVDLQATPPQHFLFEQTDLAELGYLQTAGSVANIDDLVSDATEDSSLSDFMGDSDSYPPPTPSSASSTASMDSLVPIFVRQGLKQTIQNRRKIAGKGELKVEFVEPPPEQLTEEEEQKRIERREKNRLAAQKCRGKKKERGDILEAETKKLESCQDNLKIEIQKLLEERDHLMDVLSVHRSVCPKLRAQSSAF